MVAMDCFFQNAFIYSKPYIGDAIRAKIRDVNSGRLTITKAKISSTYNPKKRNFKAFYPRVWCNFVHILFPSNYPLQWKIVFSKIYTPA